MNRPPRRSRTALVVAAAAIVLLAVFGIWSRQQTDLPATSAPPRKVTVAQFGDFFLYAPLYVAQDGGFFRQEGLDVTIVNTGGDDKTWAAVISGSADFGVADPTFVAVSAARGQPGLVIASLVNGVPFWGITFRRLAPLTNAADLAKYSVATFPSPSTAFALQKKMFTDAGLKANIREGSFGAIIPMLKARKADIGLELEPNVSQAVADGATIVYSLASRYGDFAITGVTTTPATFERDPKLVRAFTNALQHAMDLLHRDPDQALTLISRRFPGVPAPVAKAALERVLADGVIPRSTTISEAAWTKAVALRMEVGDLSQPAPYSRFVRSVDSTPR